MLVVLGEVIYIIFKFIPIAKDSSNQKLSLALMLPRNQASTDTNIWILKNYSFAKDMKLVITEMHRHPVFEIFKLRIFNGFGPVLNKSNNTSYIIQNGKEL